MADFLKYFAPITITGQPEWSKLGDTYLVTKSQVVTYVGDEITTGIAAVRGGSVASGETKDVNGNAVYTYITSNSTDAGGNGKGGKLVKLNSSGLIADSMLPPLAITNITAGTTQPAEGSVQTGDVFVNTDENKTYIYTGSQWQEILTPADGVTSVNGQPGPTVSLSAADVSAIATDDLVTSVTSASVDTKVPSAKAVYTFVNGNYAAKSHDHTSANITDSISAASGVTSTEAKLVQAKAVYDYAAPKSHTHTSANISDSISAGTGITSTETKLVQAKAVQAYVATQISGLNLGTTYVAIADGIDAGTGITATADGWTQGKAVYEYVASAITALDLANTYAAKSHTHTVSEISDWSSKFGTGLSVDASTKAVSIAAATASALGGVIVTTGNGLTYSSNKLSMALANGTTAGAVKQGTGITITSGAVAVNFSTDISADASSDIKAATPKAVKSYVDAATSVDSGVGTITGDGTKKKFSVAHSFGSDVLVQVVNSDGETVYVPVTRAAAKVDVEFATAPANGTTFKVYIRKVATTALTVS